MPIKGLRLTEDRELEIDVDPKKFRRAVENRQLIRIENSKGEVLGINPDHVLYWVEVGAEGESTVHRARELA